MNAALVLPPPEYEPRDASPRRLLLVAGGLILGIALTLLSAAALYWTSYRDAAPLAPAGRQTAFQESPHVQSAIATDWLSTTLTLSRAKPIISLACSADCTVPESFDETRRASTS